MSKEGDFKSQVRGIYQMLMILFVLFVLLIIWYVYKLLTVFSSTFWCEIAQIFVRIVVPELPLSLCQGVCMSTSFCFCFLVWSKIHSGWCLLFRQFESSPVYQSWTAASSHRLKVSIHHSPLLRWIQTWIPYRHHSPKIQQSCWLMVLPTDGITMISSSSSWDGLIVVDLPSIIPSLTILVVSL